MYTQYMLCTCHAHVMYMSCTCHVHACTHTYSVRIDTRWVVQIIMPTHACTCTHKYKVFLNSSLIRVYVHQTYLKMEWPFECNCICVMERECVRKRETETETETERGENNSRKLPWEENPKHLGCGLAQLVESIHNKLGLL